MPPIPGLDAALARFQTALSDPQRTQRRILDGILRANCGTLYVPQTRVCAHPQL
ncbi:hypothetical protein [Kingella potus]|uniref:hypothetical protein n=1 Tax=Kingella potus TaxID=265175 RepID=UPI001FD24077|nr:hypothetical protein [Kingella potus]UOP01640.1 hypothetical protein LVJ84_05650 [Kingella potus]